MNKEFEQANPRGSVWHRWEPHIHTPGTTMNDQYGGAGAWEDFLLAVESSDPPIRAIGVTDYLTLDAYEEVVRWKNAGRLPNVELVFPNVEIRFGIETAKGSPINVHLLVSPEDREHVHCVRRFLRALEFKYQGESYRCDKEDLIRLGKIHDRMVLDDLAALAVGTNQFKVNFEQLREEWNKSTWIQRNALIAVSGGTTDGTSGLQIDKSFAALRKEIEAFAQIIFSGNPKQRAFWLGKGAATLTDLEEKWGGKKPCLHGSDAHEQSKVGIPDYGRLCWVKGDLTFEALRQTCIEPECRTFIGECLPQRGLTSQIITELRVADAPWWTNNAIPLNPGLVAVVGARGSGKTALADLIAAGGLAVSAHLNSRSFISRAASLLGDSQAELIWKNEEKSRAKLRSIGEEEPLDSPRVQYLSQQFVDQLCSSEGLHDELVSEIQRVIFQAHPIDARLGARSFNEFLELSTENARRCRARQEEILADAAHEIMVERTKKATLGTLLKQSEEKKKLIAKDRQDRKDLIGKGNEERTTRLTELTDAVDRASRKIESFEKRNRALQALQDEVSDTRIRIARDRLTRLRQQYSDAELSDEEWRMFQLDFVGPVDSLLNEEKKKVAQFIQKVRGPRLNHSDSGIPDLELARMPPLISVDADLNCETLNVLEREAQRLRSLVGIDKENSKKLAKLNERVAKEESALLKLDKDIELAQEAEFVIKEAVERRQRAYEAIFEAIVAEEEALVSLYAPLRKHLESQQGTLAKLGFSVRRIVDCAGWAARGEALLDLRKSGPFRGKGALLDAAVAELLPAWRHGSAAEVSDAMRRFREKHERGLMEHSLADRTDRDEFEQWGRDISEWLYGTDHITVRYAVQYDGIDIEQLSPGTRGIVLLLLYLAIDTEDDRPLIIDQPEENLDPLSVYQELVSHFREARTRRQIIIVSHNANLVVNTDADQVIVASCGPHCPGKLPRLHYVSGGLENPEIRKCICELLEGGEAAFRERAKRLRLKL